MPDRELLRLPTSLDALDVGAIEQIRASLIAGDLRLDWGAVISPGSATSSSTPSPMA